MFIHILHHLIVCYSLIMTQKPILHMFLGSPGSGKSFFARNLAENINAVRLNGDSMRIALYGSPEEIDQQPDKNLVNSRTFGALDYSVVQVLKAGHSVVYDAHHNKRSIRARLEELAEEHGAVPVVVWIKTPYEVALKRGQTRDTTPDQRRLSEEKMIETIERHMANFDEPVESELVITIDGTIPFEEQLASYKRQISSLLK